MFSGLSQINTASARSFMHSLTFGLNLCIFTNILQYVYGKTKRTRAHKDSFCRKWGPFNMNTMMIAADLVMIMCGCTALLTLNSTFKWTLYVIGWVGMVIVFAVVWQIFDDAIIKFQKAARSGGQIKEMSAKIDMEVSVSPEFDAYLCLSILLVCNQSTYCRTIHV